MSITYPPEMLPTADGPAEVIVVDPVTGSKTVVHATGEGPAITKSLRDYIDEHYGERCSDFDVQCPTCRLWSSLDHIEEIISE